MIVSRTKLHYSDVCISSLCYMNDVQRFQLSPDQHALTAHQQLHVGVTVW